ncbi:MAG: iron ABC transporter permease [Ethanoligenens sp.]|uniref:FecCD family ABC transporter permease n=1 Tax=Ethanoligenens sp. TaxID=2099655 RepID=UPI0039EAA96E
MDVNEIAKSTPTVLNTRRMGGERVKGRPPLRMVVCIGLVLLAALLLFSLCINVLGTRINPLPRSLGELSSYLYWKAQIVFHPDSSLAQSHQSQSAPDSFSQLQTAVFAMFTGIALAVPGVGFQAVFRNPVASPSVLGVTNACGTGLAIFVYLSGSLTIITAAAVFGAFICGFASVGLVIAISAAMSRGRLSADTLLLTGIVLSALFNAIYLSVLAKMQGSQMSLVNGAFSLGNIGTAPQTLLPALAVGIVPLWLLRSRINVLAFGKEQAQALGINTRVLSLLILLTSTFLEATIITACGIIGWVGLVVPHISRLLVGADVRRVLPMSMLAGAILVLASNIVSQFLHIPVGTVVAFVGTPLFLYLLAKNRGAVE